MSKFFVILMQLKYNLSGDYIIYNIYQIATVQSDYFTTPRSK
jgi:hypothetical protein